MRRRAASNVGRSTGRICSSDCKTSMIGRPFCNCSAPCRTQLHPTRFIRSLNPPTSDQLSKHRAFFRRVCNLSEPPSRPRISQAQPNAVLIHCRKLCSSSRCQDTRLTNDPSCRIGSSRRPCRLSRHCRRHRGPLHSHVASRPHLPSWRPMSPDLIHWSPCAAPRLYSPMPSVRSVHTGNTLLPHRLHHYRFHRCWMLVWW